MCRDIVLKKLARVLVSKYPDKSYMIQDFITGVDDCCLELYKEMSEQHIVEDFEIFERIVNNDAKTYLENLL